MNISAISNQNTNFKGYVPIRKVLRMGANGREYAMDIEAAANAVTALVSRINNNPHEPETRFMSEFFPMLAKYPFVASSILGTPCTKMVFGESDISLLRKLSTDVYHKGEAAIEDVNIEIAQKIFPAYKCLKKRRFLGDTVGEPISIVLHANKVKEKGHSKPIYRFGIDITNPSGNSVFAVLKSPVPQVAQKQPKVNFYPTLF